MADEIFTNALGGVLMLNLLAAYAIYLKIKTGRGGVIAWYEKDVFRAMCIVALAATLIYLARTF